MLTYVGAAIAGRRIKAVHPLQKDGVVRVSNISAEFTAGPSEMGWRDAVVLIFDDGTFTVLASGRVIGADGVFALPEAHLVSSPWTTKWLVEIGVMTQSEVDGFRSAEQALLEAQSYEYDLARYAKLRAKFEDKEPADVPLPPSPPSRDYDGGLFRTLFRRR